MSLTKDQIDKIINLVWRAFLIISLSSLLAYGVLDIEDIEKLITFLLPK